MRDSFFEKWEETLETHGLINAPHRVFNLDKTGLNTNQSSSLVYSSKGARDTYQLQPTCGKTMYTI